MSVVQSRPTCALNVQGRYLDDLAIDIPRALMLPANRARNTTATVELGLWRHNVSMYLSTTARTHPDVLTVLCRLAEYLDTHGSSPIDYRRRRATFPTVELGDQDWKDLCHTAKTHPGRAARHTHARRYLFQLLTGGDLAKANHTLTFHGQDRDNYLTWQYQMPSHLRQILREHAADLLADAGIDEPLTWSPPASLAAGLKLPGRDPDDIDLQRLYYLAITAQLPVTFAAGQLGVHHEHVRHALQQLDRAPMRYNKYSMVTAKMARARAAEILTADFFHRENTLEGKDIQTLVDETGFGRNIIAHFARLIGHKFVHQPARGDFFPVKQPPRFKAPRAKRADRVDRAWLGEQAGKLFRTNDDIAAELGLRGETIRRYRARFNIRGRMPDSRGHVVTNLKHPDLPRDIRRAVEGQRNGWQRLQRFQQMMAYPSVNSAAKALGLHTQNLDLQIHRLETDISAQLLHRAPHRYAPMAATRRGKQLLLDLGQPDIAQLMNHYAAANAPPKAGSQDRRRVVKHEPDGL